MSCSSCGTARCSCDPCSTASPVNAGYETLSSALDNFIYNFYGTVTKTVVDGKVVWTLPCDLATGIPGYPRDPALGTACYFKELFVDFDSRITGVEGLVTAARVAADAAQVSANLALAEIAALGTMSAQNSTAVSITGGTITGAHVTGLSAPSVASDAVPKSYADAIAGGISPQLAVRVASTANVTVSSAPATVDGVTLAATNRVLLKNQTLAKENGIYTFASVGSALTRATDADTAGELTANRYYFVSEGAVNIGTGWFISTAPTVLGTDPIQFSQFSASSTYSAGTGLSLAGSQFSIDTTVVMRRAQNLADVSSVSTARSNLGVTATGVDTTYAYRANNLSDLANAGTARGNLGLGSLALQAAGAVAITGGTITGLSELKTAYGVFSGALAAYDASAGALYAGFSAGAGFIRSVIDNAGGYAPLLVQVGNGTQAGIFTNLGLQADLGMGVPGQAIFTTVNWASNAGLRTTKANAHLLINVKDYGAAGDGGTNDTASINAAIAAMTNYSTLYFPAGDYFVTPGGITEFASLNHITVMGDGHSSVLTNNATGAPGNYLVFHSSCHHVTIRDFSIIGAATVRGSGIGIRMYASDAFVSRIYISGTSDFGLLVTNDAGGYTSRVHVTDCVSDRTLGDGFHFGAVTDSGLYDCQAYYTGDDGVGIGDDGAVGFPPTRIEVVGFTSLQAGNHAGGGTHGSGIRIFDGALDIHIVGGQIKESCEAGFQTTRASSTTAYNTRIHVNGLKVYSCLQTAGMYGNFSLAFCNQVSLQGCWSESPVSQCCFAFLDCNDLSVSGCTGKNGVVRTFVTDDGTTTNVAAAWSNWSFVGNTSFGAPSNESFYFVPATGKTIANLVVAGNTDVGGTAATYLTTNRLATAAKVMNNISLNGKSIANGGTGLSPTLANNN